MLKQHLDKNIILICIHIVCEKQQMLDSQEIDLQLDARRIFANDSRCRCLSVYAFLVPLDSRLKPGLHVRGRGH